jgi:hypothetical protein
MRKRLLIGLLAVLCLGAGGEELPVAEEMQVPPVPTIDWSPYGDTGYYRRPEGGWGEVRNGKHIRFTQTLPDPIVAFYSAETPTRAYANDYRFMVVNLRHGSGSLVIDREHGHVVRCIGQYRHGLGIRANDFGCDLLGGEAR